MAVEKSKRSDDDVIIVQGQDKPAPIQGRKWIPVKNNPLKPQKIRAWKLGEPGTGEPFPKGGSGEETIVEGSEMESRRSPQFPVVDSEKMERDFVAAGEPTKGAKIDD